MPAAPRLAAPSLAATSLAAPLAALALLGSVCGTAAAQARSPRVFCNPLNIGYGYTPFDDREAHRATADPVIVLFKGTYYLFATNQWGYWWSEDLVDWTFVPRLFLKDRHDTKDELCAPAAWVMNGELYLIGSTYTTDFTLWKSADPRTDTWVEAKDPFGTPAWDPGFFRDDDGRLYLYHGSSNTKPIFGLELNPETFAPKGEQTELLRLDPARHGWHRFGEHHDNTFLDPFIEGAWMNKFNGRYYLQYGAPGTEFSGYADGVAVADSPLGPFTNQRHNPFASKLGGFARGAGHGSTFQDRYGNWWHVGTLALSVKNNFERRIGLWPAGFDADGVMFCNTAYGDFPMHAPAHPFDTRDGAATGWMLLNHAKPVTASSSLGALTPNLAVDEDIRTHWSAATANAGEWITSDLGSPCTLHAVQINYADQNADIRGNPRGRRHRYVLEASADGDSWTVAADKSASEADTPHDLVVFEPPLSARFIRLRNIEVPTGTFALSGLRAFGVAPTIAPPRPVAGFRVLRGASEPRNAWLKWPRDPNATGYVIRAGIDKDKLYTAVTVTNASEYYFRALDADQPHHFQIEAFNEAGVSARTPVVRIGVPTAESSVLDVTAGE